MPESRLKDSKVTVITVLNSFYDFFKDMFISYLQNTIQGVSDKLLSPMEKQHFMNV